MVVSTVAIRFELGDHHTYEFVEGVLPCPIDPELQSFATDDSPCFQYFDLSSPASYLQAVEQLDSFITTEGPFDGILAFSQGATIAGTLLARQYQNVNDGVIAPNSPPFKCAIFFSGIQPVDWEELATGEVRILDAGVDGDLLKLPTVHVWGRQDLMWSKESENLSRLCDSHSRMICIHNGGHEIPGPRLGNSVAEAVRAIRRTIDSSLAAT
ncbi:hypothetical protein EYC80_000615 [Monilinia laxa]|uniref:Serine hydrolase domain-containing protein n=1 Tax=Monilinia laxa TaxID=61186 RepID=A0A5N6KB91_MONLA|nr:hypothetical protein EYC80_000615 [Monilinia laxa]